MKKRNKIILLIITLLVILSLFFLYFFMNKRQTSLTVQEKQWIENNKNDVIDVSIVSDVPILTYHGSGLVFDFLNYTAKSTGLSFNPVATTSSVNIENAYSFSLKDKVSKNDVLIDTDNYILISRSNLMYSSLKDITSKKIGILESDMQLFNNVFDESNSFVTYKTIEELQSSQDVDLIITLKSMALEYLVSNNLNISYSFDIKKYYVLTLNGNVELNSIFKKNYEEWKSQNYRASYNENLLKDYYDISKIDAIEQTNLKKQKYVYGFVENGIYDYFKSGRLSGINKTVMKEFSDFSGVSIKYEEFNNRQEMIDAFNHNRVDIVFNDINNHKLNNDIFSTNSGISSTLVLVSNIDNVFNIQDFTDVKDKIVYTVKNSQSEKLLKDLGFKVKTVSNLDQLLKLNSHKVLFAIDLDNYEFYKTRDLKNCKIIYSFDKNNYNYLVNAKDNETFANLFNFYTNYINLEKLMDDHYSEYAYRTINYTVILLIMLILMALLMIISIVKRFKRLIKRILESRRETLSKEEKLKYIDQLTSLKNRAYLNSQVEKWDESEAYPQCVIIIDLNNIAYINDNYGREEGDRIIREAANILIQTQLPNTEIIRTDGNEFLIYAVGYNEKEIVSYLRRLAKIFKTIDHGFGAATGYSMILDAIKTFDDAVNEATIEMKQSKEDSSK